MASVQRTGQKVPVESYRLSVPSLVPCTAFLGLPEICFERKRERERERERERLFGTASRQMHGRMLALYDRTTNRICSLVQTIWSLPPISQASAGMGEPRVGAW